MVLKYIQNQNKQTGRVHTILGKHVQIVVKDYAPGASSSYNDQYVFDEETYSQKLMLLSIIIYVYVNVEGDTKTADSVKFIADDQFQRGPLPIFIHVKKTNIIFDNQKKQKYIKIVNDSWLHVHCA